MHGVHPEETVADPEVRETVAQEPDMVDSSISAIQTGPGRAEEVDVGADSASRSNSPSSRDDLRDSGMLSSAACFADS